MDKVFATHGGRLSIQFWLIKCFLKSEAKCLTRGANRAAAKLSQFAWNHVSLSPQPAGASKWKFTHNCLNEKRW